jgi:hypothetical protein
MTRTIFAMAVAALIFGAIPKTSQAAPIAPLTGVTVDHSSNLTQVWWGRRCWRGRWGRIHCRRVWW